MFSCMFRRKRIQLIKRLLELRVRKEHEIRRKGEAMDESDAGTSDQLTDEGLLRNAVLKRLKDNQLEMLLEAVESGGGVASCVLIPKDAIQEPHALGCRFWRWPDVRSCAELRRMPACSSATDPIYMCCNPFHYSRLCQPESPPPPYSRFNNERLKPEDRAPSEHNSNIMPYVAYHSHLLCNEPYYESDKFRGSLSTSGGESELKENEWCKLAYWELSHRVGPAYPVQNTSINIFWTDMQADGLSLETLAHHSISPPDSVHKNRNKIGLGITLSLEEDGVWLYNRSEWPVFVNSPSLDRPGCRTFLVYRVPAGHCFRIFRPELGGPHPSPSFWQEEAYATGPVDPNSVRISFAKGWGPKYHRQEITGCPTWLEVLLSPCR